jgi:hypothetical protein
MGRIGSADKIAVPDVKFGPESPEKTAYLVHIFPGA